MKKPGSKLVTRAGMVAYVDQRIAASEDFQQQAFAAGLQGVLDRYHAMHVEPLLERIAVLEHLLPGEDNPIANGYAGVCPRDGAALIWADIQGTMRKWCRVCMSRSLESVPGAGAVTAESVPEP